MQNGCSLALEGAKPLIYPFWSDKHQETLGCNGNKALYMLDKDWLPLDYFLGLTLRKSLILPCKNVLQK